VPKPVKSRAFDAFMPDTEPGEEMGNARQMPLDRIDANPKQSRQRFDEASLDELRLSIEQHGVLEPILVRKVGERYQILAGERRYQAAVGAGLSYIPAVIHEDLDDEEAAFITALENLQREDLDLEDEARQFAWLIEVTGLSQRKLAARLGKTLNYVSRRLRILNERPDLFTAIRQGRITQREALDLLADDSAAGRPLLPTTGDKEVYHGGTPGAQNESPWEEPPPADRGVGLNDPPLIGNGMASRETAGTTAHEEEYQAGLPTTEAREVYHGGTSQPPAERIPRAEMLDPLEAARTPIAFKPAVRFTRYVQGLQPTDVPPPQRLALADQLEAAAREASVAARALRQAAGGQA
jgi:ParB/RepB/Spo0J family partition protein